MENCDKFSFSTEIYIITDNEELCDEIQERLLEVLGNGGICSYIIEEFDNTETTFVKFCIDYVILPDETIMQAFKFYHLGYVSIVREMAGILAKVSFIEARSEMEIVSHV